MRAAGLSGNAELLSDLLFKPGIHHVLRREEPLFNEFPEAWAFGAFPRRDVLRISTGVLGVLQVNQPLVKELATATQPSSSMLT
jgi:hypothetical protein